MRLGNFMYRKCVITKFLPVTCKLAANYVSTFVNTKIELSQVFTLVVFVEVNLSLFLCVYRASSI
jgi:hypothetical protein